MIRIEGIEVIFEYIPEHYAGEYISVIVKAKQSQITENLKSQITEYIEKMQFYD